MRPRHEPNRALPPERWPTVGQIGVISDTHGLVRPAALDALANVDLIVHAGDIGDAHVLEVLARIAPVRAVRGNCDHEPFARRLPLTLTIEASNLLLHVIHDRSRLSTVEASCALVIAGHTHRPAIETLDGVLYLNPGSAGPRRFDLPATVARVSLGAHGAKAEHIALPP
jgi:hypothetical protein